MDIFALVISFIIGVVVPFLLIDQVIVGAMLLKIET